MLRDRLRKRFDFVPAGMSCERHDQVQPFAAARLGGIGLVLHVGFPMEIFGVPPYALLAALKQIGHVVGMFFLYRKDFLK